MNIKIGLSAQLLTLAALTPVSSHAQSSALGDIVREHGRVVLMDRHRSFDYCLEQNPHAERAGIAHKLGYSWDDVRGHWEPDYRLEVDLTQLPVGAVYLPTIRQLAEYAQNDGLEIRETEFPGVFYGSPQVREEWERLGKLGFTAVHKRNISGHRTVDFYFSAHGYRRPDGDLGGYEFWSSSDTTWTAARYVYRLNGITGELDEGFNGDSGAVRCMRP